MFLDPFYFKVKWEKKTELSDYFVQQKVKNRGFNRDTITQQHTPWPACVIG